MLRFPEPLAADLAGAARQAIMDAMTHGGARSGASPSGEVAAVKTLVLDGFDAISAAWGPRLAGIGRRLDVTAVFIHGRPQVTWPGGRCELADLLIVIDDCGSTGVVRDRRAVLVQAKLGSGKVKLPATQDRVQFDLMETWPTFNFVDSAYDPRPRSFATPPGSRTGLSGEYGLIDLRSSPRAWTQWLPNPGYSFVGEADLADFLVHMTMGSYLYGRAAAAAGHDDWSFTVDELMSVAGRLGITKGSSTLRGNPNVIAMMTPDGSDHGAGSGEDAFELDGPEALSFVRLALVGED